MERLLGDSQMHTCFLRVRGQRLQAALQLIVMPCSSHWPPRCTSEGLLSRHPLPSLSLFLCLLRSHHCLRFLFTEHSVRNGSSPLPQLPFPVSSVSEMDPLPLPQLPLAVSSELPTAENAPQDPLCVWAPVLVRVSLL